MQKITFIAILSFLSFITIIFIGSFFPNSKLTNFNNRLISTDIKPAVINMQDYSSPDLSVNTTQFNLQEIAKHKTKKDCYLTINNKVYDVSSYMPLHPAGSNIIVSRCGKEVTNIFAKIHSNFAWDLLAKYKIGDINVGPSINTPGLLSAVSSGLKTSNPNATVIKVSPKKDYFVAKLIYNNKLYEVHVNNQGDIIKEEIEDDESNWSLWDSDSDDE